MLLLLLPMLLLLLSLQLLVLPMLLPLLPMLLLLLPMLLLLLSLQLLLLPMLLLLLPTAMLDIMATLDTTATHTTKFFFPYIRFPSKPQYPCLVSPSIEGCNNNYNPSQWCRDNQ